MGYESRSELARLLFADMDQAVAWIVAQPFRMVVEINGKHRSHVPDYLLSTVDGSGDRGRLFVGFDVFSDPDPVLLGNVRFLAGYRRGVVVEVCYCWSRRGVRSRR